MAQVIINLARQVVESKVEAILQESSSAMPLSWRESTRLHEELVAHTLKHMPSIYAAVETSGACAATSLTCAEGGNVSCFSSDQHRQMEALIRDRLARLQQQPQPRQVAASPSTRTAEPAPSHWFG